MPTLISVFEYRFVRPDFAGYPDGRAWRDWISQRFTEVTLDGIGGWMPRADQAPMTPAQVERFRRENPRAVAAFEEDIELRLLIAVENRRSRRMECEASGHGCGIRDGLRWCEWMLREAEGSTRTDERTLLVEVDVL